MTGPVVGLVIPGSTVDGGGEVVLVASDTRFSGGRFVHGEGFALGGNHVTMDLARGLSTRIADAERIKTLYGSVMSSSSDERDMIAVKLTPDLRWSVAGSPAYFAARGRPRRAN